MTEQQIATMVQLRLEGNSSSAIAEATGISVNTIKSYCSRHGIPAPQRVRTCPLCHAEVTSAHRFCSDACWQEWYESHQDEDPELLRICKACGVVFELRQRNQEYYSKQCFYTDRYHRQPKADETRQRLLASVPREATVAIVNMTMDYLVECGSVCFDNGRMPDPSCIVDTLSIERYCKSTAIICSMQSELSKHIT